MFSKVNFVLLLAVTLSALYVTDLQFLIAREMKQFGKEQAIEKRLKQDKVNFEYEQSQYLDINLMMQAAEKMNMHKPTSEETIVIKINE